MSSLHVELVAADRQVWSGEAHLVRARSIEGELGIMPGHTPVLAVLISGDITIHGESGEETATIDGGFMSVEHNRVTIVADNVQTTATTRS